MVRWHEQARLRRALSSMWNPGFGALRPAALGGAALGGKVTGLRPRRIGPGSGGQRANDEDAAMGSCPTSGGLRCPHRPRASPIPATVHWGFIALRRAHGVGLNFCLIRCCPAVGFDQRRCRLRHPPRVIPTHRGPRAAIHASWSPTHRGPRAAIHASWSPTHRGPRAAIHAPWSPTHRGPRAAIHASWSPTHRGPRAAIHASCPPCRQPGRTPGSDDSPRRTSIQFGVRPASGIRKPPTMRPRGLLLAGARLASFPSPVGSGSPIIDRDILSPLARLGGDGHS